MRLTQKQETFIARYLRDVLVQLDTALPEKARQRGLERLQTRVDRDLASVQKEVPADADVQAILERLGPPSHQATLIVTGATTPMHELALDTTNCIWLGVCAGLAHRLEIEPWMIRITAFAVGLCTGPLAILGYIGLYVAMYLVSDKKKTPRVNLWRVAWHPFATFVTAMLLVRGTDYAVDFIHYAHAEYLKRPVPTLGEWGWLAWRGDSMFFWTVVICVPIAVLSGLPLANAWDKSLKRVAQAGLALYGIGLAFGIASILVGIILDFVREFSG